MAAAKAIIAGIVAGLAPVATALQAGNFSAATVVVALSSALVAFGAVFFVPNKASA